MAWRTTGSGFLSREELDFFSLPAAEEERQRENFPLKRIGAGLGDFLQEMPVRRCVVICTSTQHVRDFFEALEDSTLAAGDRLVIEGGGVCEECWERAPRYARLERLFDDDGNIPPDVLDRLLDGERNAGALTRYVYSPHFGQLKAEFLENQALAEYHARNSGLAFFMLICMPLPPSMLSILLTSYPAVIIDSQVYADREFAPAAGKKPGHMLLPGTLLSGFAEHHRLAQKNALLESLLNRVDTPVLAGYLDGSVMGANEAFLELGGFAAGEVGAHNWNVDLACPGFQVLQEEVFSALLVTGRPQELYTELLAGDGSCVPCRVELALHGEDNGRPAFFSAVYRKAEEQLSCPPEKAPGNAFAESLRMALLRSTRQAGYSFAVLCLGIDNAAQVPLQSGEGDSFAAMLSKRISNCLRVQDVPAEVDAERFCILLDNVAGVIEAVRVAQRIQEETGRAFRVGRRELQVTCSIGAVLGPGSYADADELLRDAGVALQRAMQRGERQIAVFDEHQNSTAAQFFRVERGLRKALRDNDVRMHYQPMWDLAQGKFRGAEALMRWDHQREGMQRAEWFLPLAGHSDVFLELESWAVRRALASLARLQQAAGESFFLGLNVSFKNILRHGFLEEILELCGEHGIRPGAVFLEMREQRVRQLADGYADVLDRIGRAGLGIVPDHFKAGHLSLADLHRLPLRGLKLDPTVLEDAALRGSILAVAGSRGLPLMATGVEDPARLETLQKLGCTYAQGNALAVDMDEQSLLELLRRQS